MSKWVRRRVDNSAENQTNLQALKGLHFTAWFSQNQRGDFRRPGSWCFPRGDKRNSSPSCKRVLRETPLLLHKRRCFYLSSTCSQATEREKYGLLGRSEYLTRPLYTGYVRKELTCVYSTPDTSWVRTVYTVRTLRLLGTVYTVRYIPCITVSKLRCTYVGIGGVQMNGKDDRPSAARNVARILLN